jgi:hypothetical protein
MEAWSTGSRYPRCRPCSGCGTTLQQPLLARESSVPHQWDRDAAGTVRCRLCEKTSRELGEFVPDVILGG